MEENKSELIVREDGKIEVTKELIANIKKFQKAKLQLTLIETELKEGFKKVMEENGIKKFLIHDPWFTYKQFSTQKTSVYRKMLSLPSNTPDWLYRYGRSKGISNPCYIMTVK